MSSSAFNVQHVNIHEHVIAEITDGFIHSVTNPWGSSSSSSGSSKSLQGFSGLLFLSLNPLTRRRKYAGGFQIRGGEGR